MEAGHGGDVHQPRLRQVVAALFIQAVPLPGEKGEQEPLRRFPVESLDALAQCPGKPLGQVAGTPGPPWADLQLPLAIYAEKDPPGGIGKALLPAEGGCAVEPHLPCNQVPGLQLQKVRVSIEHPAAPQAGQADRTARAITACLRIIRQLQGDRRLLPGHPFRRGEEQGMVSGQPQDSRRKACGHDAHSPPGLAGEGICQQRAGRRPGPPGFRQKVQAEKYPHPEGQGKQHQPPHPHTISHTTFLFVTKKKQTNRFHPL